MPKPLRFFGTLWISFLFAPALLVAQQKPLHINPVIAKLYEGKTVYGLNTADLSLAYAREVARAPVDFVYADLEHNPLDFPALDIGLMGVIFNGVDTKDQALFAVRTMRYPQLKGSPRREPAGIRGYAPGG